MEEPSTGVNTSAISVWGGGEGRWRVRGHCGKQNSWKALPKGPRPTLISLADTVDLSILQCTHSYWSCAHLLIIPDFVREILRGGGGESEPEFLYWNFWRLLDDAVWHIPWSLHTRRWYFTRVHITVCFRKVLQCVLFAVTPEIVRNHVSNVSHATPLSNNQMVQ
jgi:hypothetical protein